MPKQKLIYVFDALCGWCYGFSPVMQKLHEQYKGAYDFEVLSGGMVRGSRVGPIGEVAPYISRAYKQVEQRTGVRFGQAFLKVLKKGRSTFTSEVPALAVLAVKKKQENKALPFAHRLQKGIYYDGMPPADFQAYGPLFEELDLPANEVLEQMKAPRLRQEMYQEFKKVEQLHVNGFPTLFLQSKDEDLQTLCQGFMDYPDLEEKLQGLSQN